MKIKKSENLLEFYEIINPILLSEEFLKRKKWPHHDRTSTYTHCLSVSKTAYILAKKWKKDFKSAAIAGLLHDFYPNKLKDREHIFKLLAKHNFIHGKQAVLNSKLFYPEHLNDKIENAIKYHMFPLVLPPTCVVGWIVLLSDKIESFDVFIDIINIPRYFRKKKPELK